ncbi:hypothetical protein B0T20DRAFT_89608 [Sordaria brevicollis]|uniref:Uncharacterized protein n=1 Tax=Sordaria brevicollis TaxID=83679 RepID=A0AAE0U384_SORBR|nr:hypothetical protein B0T20DRAFT_89608 [Sordaria brevicollis]
MPSIRRISVASRQLPLRYLVGYLPLAKTPLRNRAQDLCLSFTLITIIPPGLQVPRRYGPVRPLPASQRQTETHLHWRGCWTSGTWPARVRDSESLKQWWCCAQTHRSMSMSKSMPQQVPGKHEEITRPPVIVIVIVLVSSNPLLPLHFFLTIFGWSPAALFAFIRLFATLRLPDRLIHASCSNRNNLRLHAPF